MIARPLWVRRRDTVGDAQHALHDVIDIRKVAGVVAVVEHVDWLARQDIAYEAEQRHVGSAPRSIDGEEAQASCRYTEQMRVCVSHQLISLLTSGIETDGVVGIVVHAEWHARVGAIDGAR